MKTAQPILEIYRSCGMLLRRKDEHIQSIVQRYLGFVQKAGYFAAKQLPIPEEVMAGLAEELMSPEEYAIAIGG